MDVRSLYNLERKGDETLKEHLHKNIQLWENSNYMEEETRITNKFKLLYGRELNILVESILEFIGTMTQCIKDGNKVPRIVITVDSDFDGYSSAKQVYQLFNLFNISDDYIDIIHLNSLHRTDEVIVLGNDLMIVTDTAIGNVRYNSTAQSKVIWIDHHEVEKEVWEHNKNILEKGNKGTFINTTMSIDEEVRGLSNGLFTHFFMLTLIKVIGFDKENENKMVNRFRSVTQLDALLSMFSDFMITDNYKGFMRQVYHADKNDFYKNLKGRWDFTNRKYFQKYIARINNAIRMERKDIIDVLITDTSTVSTVRDIERLEEDRKIIMNAYFYNLEPEYDFSINDLTLQVYQIPYARSDVMRNFKGLLASIKMPRDGTPYVIFSLSKNNGTINISVRSNIEDIDLQENFKRRLDTKEIGGHQGAFGITIEKREYPYFLSAVAELRRSEVSNTKIKNNYIKFKDLKNKLQALSDISKHNEYTREPIKVLFKEEDFISKQVEQKRTVYTIGIEGNQTGVEIVSFDLEKKNQLIAVPNLKEGIQEEYTFDILESG